MADGSLGSNALRAISVAQHPLCVLELISEGNEHGLPAEQPQTQFEYAASALAGAVLRPTQDPSSHTKWSIASIA